MEWIFSCQYYLKFHQWKPFKKFTGGIIILILYALAVIIRGYDLKLPFEVDVLVQCFQTPHFLVHFIFP